MKIKITGIDQSDVWSKHAVVLISQIFITDDMFSNVGVQGHSTAHGKLADNKLHEAVFGTNEPIMFSAITYTVI